jgi:hypothetical protein
MRTRTVALLTAGAVLTVAAAAVLAGVALGGLSGFSARSEPAFVERLLAREARRLAIPRSARTLQNPIAFSPEVWAASREHFADHCATCHANDGSGTTELGQSLYPKAPDMRLADTQELTDGEIYWIIENGVRFTGMPAWGTGGDDDDETWHLVHFIRHLKDLTPDLVKEMEGLNPKSPLELKEEEDDRRFLAGEDVEETPSSGHHHDKE